MKKIYIIDGNNFIYRMFYGLPEFSTKDGKIVNAIFGMAKFFVQQLVREKPDYIFFVKDGKGKNFRHELYSEYKSTRDRMPDNLKSQIDDIEKMIKLMGIHILVENGYEADDVIGTLATQLSKEKYNDIYILSGDKDLYSLVNGNVRMYDTMKKKVFDKIKTKEKFGIEAEMIIDYLSIVGDKSDNIPGIDGFGPKKAVCLINEIGSIENIYNEVEKVESGKKTYKDFEKSIASCFKGKTFEKLINSRDDAFLSKKLATVHLDINLDDIVFEEYKFESKKILNDKVKEYFKSLEFYSLIGEEEKHLLKWDDLKLEVKLIQNKQQLEKLFDKIKNLKEIIIDTETTSLNVMQADLVGISVYLDDDNIYYINRGHEGEKVEDEDLVKFLNNLLNLDIIIVGHNLKYDLEIIDLYVKYIDEESVKNEEGIDGGQIKMF